MTGFCKNGNEPLVFITGGYFSDYRILTGGTAVVQWLRGVLQIGRSLVRSQLVSLKFFIEIKSFRSYYGPGVDSASNINEYQEHFLGGKCGRCVRLTTLPPFCDVMKSGNLNFLEPSRSLQACNGAALPLPFTEY